MPMPKLPLLLPRIMPGRRPVASRKHMNWPFQPLLPGAAQLEIPRTLTADAGSFGLSGQAATPRRTLRLSATSAAFVLAGKAAGLLRASRLAAAHGQIPLTGQSASIT